MMLLLLCALLAALNHDTQMLDPFNGLRLVLSKSTVPTLRPVTLSFLSHNGPIDGRNQLVKHEWSQKVLPSAIVVGMKQGTKFNETNTLPSVSTVETLRPRLLSFLSHSGVLRLGQFLGLKLVKPKKQHPIFGGFSEGIIWAADGRWCATQSKSGNPSNPAPHLLVGAAYSSDPIGDGPGPPYSPQ